MQATSLGQSPDTENTVIRAAKATLRVLMAAYFMAAATAMLIDPAAPAPLGGLFAPDAALVIASILFLGGGALLFGAMVRPATLILLGYVFLSAYAHLGFASSAAAPEAFMADVALLSLILLVRTDLRRRSQPGEVLSPQIPRAPSGPTKTNRPAQYVKALEAAAERWDRDAA